MYVNDLEKARNFFVKYLNGNLCGSFFCIYFKNIPEGIDPYVTS